MNNKGNKKMKMISLLYKVKNQVQSLYTSPCALLFPLNTPNPFLGNINIKQEDFPMLVHEQCEICFKKDEEDLYIIFNVLYRVVIGGVFHRRSKDEGLSYELDMMQRLEPEAEEKGLKDEDQTPEDKIISFKEKINRNLLVGVITSKEFNEAVKDIFKAKYEALKEQCHHFELAM